MRVDMCVDMCVDMRVDMRVDVCLDTGMGMRGYMGAQGVEEAEAGDAEGQRNDADAVARRLCVWTCV